MFWRKKRKKAVNKIEGAVWGYIAGRHGVTVNMLQNLRRVECDGVVGGKQVTMIRIFDPASANEKGVAIEDYESLDSHPELILYEGYYQKTPAGEATNIRIEKK